MLKKRFVLTAALLGFLSLGLHAQTLTVAASAIPHAEILEFVKPTLAREGVDLQIKVFDDYVQPNVQVSDRSQPPLTSDLCLGETAAPVRSTPLVCA